MKIVVSEFIPNAFSSEQALILRDIMENELSKEEHIELDFTGIKRFTTLFFNFSTAYHITKMSPEVYEKRVTISNLSSLGQTTYNNSCNNAIRKYSDESRENILEIIKNPED